MVDHADISKLVGMNFMGKMAVREKKFRDEIRNVILDKKSSGHLKNSKTKD